MTTKKGVGVRLPKEIVEFFDELKEKKGVSRNASARMAIKNILAERENAMDITLDVYSDDFEINAKNNEHYNLYIPTESINQLDELAKELDMTRSDLLRVALIRLMKKLKNKE